MENIERTIALIRKESLDSFKHLRTAYENNWRDNIAFAKGTCAGLERAVALIKFTTECYRDDLESHKKHQEDIREILGEYDYAWYGEELEEEVGK
jgi:hypothetical protein